MHRIYPKTQFLTQRLCESDMSKWVIRCVTKSTKNAIAEKNDTQLSIATQFMCAKFRQLGIMPSIT